MIDHPFLSFKDLSDDELLDKMSEITKRLNKAYLWGSSSDLVNQLQWMLEMIEEEKLERWKKQMFEMQNTVFPETVESDPEYKKERTEADDTAKVVKPAAKKSQNLPVPNFNKEYLTKDKK